MPRPRQVIQSYKQVNNVAPASYAAATQINIVVSQGVDNYTGPSVANNEVPTGAVINTIDVQVSAVNLVSIASFFWLTMQRLHSGQTALVDPQAVGGSPQRNQVFLQLQRVLGPDQNNNFHFRFKVPKKYQRVREGDLWYCTVKSDTIWTGAFQFIYKFYR